MSTARYIIGDTRDVTASLPDASVDLVMTSPPFLALRSYLPPDHPDKWREIGSEPTPAEFLQTLLELTAEWRRVLAPHGSIAVELGDTYAGSGGAGGDYGPDGMRGGQEKFKGSALADRKNKVLRADGNRMQQGNGWPMDKSICGIPWLYALSLAYGRNMLTGEPSPAGQWRVRNVVAWCRPNPPVGALGDKYRPATSYMTIATVARDRYFDLDAVRTPHQIPPETRKPGVTGKKGDALARGVGGDSGRSHVLHEGNPAGAPPLDYWVIPTAPYSGKTPPTARRVPCGPDDGGERTTSPDCPVHAGPIDPAPTARCDEHGSQTENHQPRTGRTDDRPGQEPLAGFGPTDASPDRSGSTPHPTTDSTDQECSPAATGRSTATHRTGLDPETTTPDTPFAETAVSTDDTSASPESSAQRPGTPESSTSADGSPDSQKSRTTDGTDCTDMRQGSPSACTCSFHKIVMESTSHYATYPPDLCTRPILSMCPQRVCTVCGEPSRRIVETVNAVGHAVQRASHRKSPGGAGDGRSGVASINSAPEYAQRETLGWTECECPGGVDRWRNGVVLDPFGGSGTTGMVATGHGRDAILVDLDARNADLARERVGMFLTVEDARPEGAA